MREIDARTQIFRPRALRLASVRRATVEDLLPRVYWHADRSLYPFAARSLLAGLQKLDQEGRATESGGAWSQRKDS